MTKKFSDLPLMEQLAIKQALFSTLGDDVSTKNPESLRSYADEQIVNNYQSMGAKSYDVNVNNMKVGSYSVRTSKAKPASTEKRVVVNDLTAFEAFVQEHATEEAIEYAQLCADNFACFLLETYGIIGDGVDIVEQTIPEQPPRVLGTTLKVDKAKVAEAIQGYLPVSIAGLLGGGDVE